MLGNLIFFFCAYHKSFTVLLRYACNNSSRVLTHNPGCVSRHVVSSLDLELTSIVLYCIVLYCIVLYRQERFNRKLTTRKVHTKLHPQLEWSIFQSSIVRISIRHFSLSHCCLCQNTLVCIIKRK